MEENYKSLYQLEKKKLRKIKLIMLDMDAAVRFWTMIYEPMEIIPEYTQKIWELVKNERKEENEERR